MQFGMPTLIEMTSLEDTLRYCRQLGLHFVELNMNLPQFQVEYLEDTDYLRELQEKYKVGLTIHLDENLNVCDFNTAVAGAYIETVRRAIRVAEKIHAPVLTMHMNHGVHFTLPDCKVELFEKYNEAYMRSWRVFRAVCEEAVGVSGIKIGIENTDGYRDYEKTAIEYLLQSEVFGLTWDVGHTNAVRNVDEPFIMKWRDRLCHFHIHDGRAGLDHLTLGTGEIDLQQRLGLASHCRCRCVVETKTADALEQSVVWLRENGWLGGCGEAGNDYGKG